MTFNPICCVYKLIFPDGNYYIGSTKNLKVRMQNYKSKFNSGKYVNALISQKQYKFDDIAVIILQILEANLTPKPFEDIHLKMAINDEKCLNRSASAHHNTVLRTHK